LNVRGFVGGLERFLSTLEEDALSTGSPKLDRLIGGVRRGWFHLVYGDREPVEDLLTNLLVEALKPDGGTRSRAVYMLCGNYRIEKTTLNAEGLVRLLKASGLEPEESLRSVHVLCAFSADQQARAVEEVGRILERDPAVRLVLVRGIAKLVADDARSRSRRAQELQGAALRLMQMCAERGIALVASCGQRGSRRGLPEPDCGTFLRHMANIIVYLRRRRKGSPYARAYLLKHPALGTSSVEYGFSGGGGMGRSTPPFRESFQKTVSRLRREFRDALLKVDRRDAFDSLVKAWSSELGAMSYAESLTLLDLLLLASAVENRSLIAELMGDVEGLRVEVGHLKRSAGKGADEG